ncbi:hypothetical protein QUC31_017250 [Theobroma cacao]
MAALNLKLVFGLAVLWMLVVDPMATAALTCDDVTGQLFPCLTYLTLRGKNVRPPPQGCCNGVRRLNKQAQSKADRQKACNCIKGLAGTFTGLNLDLVEGLPRRCNVNIPYKISPSTDCKKYIYIRFAFISLLTISYIIILSF